MVSLAWGHLALSTDRQVLGEQEKKDGNQQTVQDRDGGFICGNSEARHGKSNPGQVPTGLSPGIGDTSNDSASSAV